MSTPIPPPIYEYEVCFRDGGSNLFIMTDHAIIMHDEKLPKWIIAALIDANTSWSTAKKIIIRTKDIMYIVLHKDPFHWKVTE